MPVSMPNNMPPKHACVCQLYVLDERQRTDRTGQSPDPPSVNLGRVRSHRLIVDELSKDERHVA